MKCNLKRHNWNQNELVKIVSQYISDISMIPCFINYYQDFDESTLENHWRNIWYR